MEYNGVRMIAPHYNGVEDIATNYEVFYDKVGPELYQIPVLSVEFCEFLINMCEEYGQWSENRHAYHSAPDILLQSLNLDEVYNQLLSNYVNLIVEKVWRMKNDPDMQNESFVIKYTPETQTFLDIHHDLSDYSINVALNNNFEGGGTVYPLQNCVIANDVGYGLIHPSMTHPHGSKPIISGIRYVLISFCCRNYY